MKQDYRSRVLQSDFVLHWLRSLRSTCWAEFVMTLCWNMILCKVSQRGPPPHQRRWCSCLSTGRGRVMWSTMGSSTATRQTRQTKYWRCVPTFYICAIWSCLIALHVGGLMKQCHTECSHWSTTNHFKIADCNVSDFICFGLRTDSTSLQTNLVPEGSIWLYFLWYSASKVQWVPKA